MSDEDENNDYPPAEGEEALEESKKEDPNAPISVKVRHLAPLKFIIIENRRQNIKA